MLTSPVLIYRPLADSCWLTSANKESSSPYLASVLRNRQRVLWSGKPSLKPKLIKRRNIKSRASCFSRSGSLKPYQLCNNKALNINSGGYAASPCFLAWMPCIRCYIVFQSINLWMTSSSSKAWRCLTRVSQLVWARFFQDMGYCCSSNRGLF
jgi:hypothetical protein